MADLLLQTVWLIPCYALIGAVLSALWFPGITRRTGPRPAGYLNTTMTFFSFLHAALAFPATWGHDPQDLSATWLKVAGLELSIPIEVSALTVGAIIVITGLNLLAQNFAIGYMELDWGWARFFSLLALFEAGMTALVLCNSLFFTYVILEILTLATYLLIGVWFNQSLVVTGARDAFLTKRIGDLFLLMGVVALLPLTGTWNYTELAVWAQTANVDPGVMTLVGLALMAGPMGKCAQFPLHLWLDEAMEGPVPASILRNSVVVATGAWVLVKLEPIMAMSPTVLTTMICIGAVSAIGGTLIAIAQIDIKRTLSYLATAYMGLVFISVGTQHAQTALLLVLTHALASALLIMSSSAIVWNNITQDVTQLGGLWSRRPVSGLSFLIGAAGLVALPPLGGFWSLLSLVSGLWESHPLLIGVVLLVNTAAAFGLTRVFCLVFKGEAQQMSQRSPEIHFWMALPMIILIGFVLHLPLVLESLSLLPKWVDLNQDAALVLAWSTIAGCTLSAVIYLGKAVPKPVRLPSKALQDLFAYDFYTPTLYRNTIILAVAVVSSIVSWFDRFLIDGVVNGLGIFTLFSGQSLKYSTTGQSQFYMMTVVLGVGLIALSLGFPFLFPETFHALSVPLSNLGL